MIKRIKWIEVLTSIGTLDSFVISGTKMDLWLKLRRKSKTVKVLLF